MDRSGWAVAVLACALDVYPFRSCRIVGNAEADRFRESKREKRKGEFRTACSIHTAPILKRCERFRRTWAL
jgi:hypothetical protein